MATRYLGQVAVQCIDFLGNSRATQFSCVRSSLQSGDFDFFEGPRIISDQVSLTSRWPDGSTRTRKGDYDFMNQTSVKKFNLWARGIMQSQLLDEGVNVIDYQMLLKNGVVEQGSFTVEVQMESNRYCEPLSFVSTEPTDCDSPYTMCEKYFSNVRTCQ